MARVVASIPFFNELDILEIHLGTLWDHVDLFVITESRQGFNGSPKPLYLSQNSDLLKRFGKKIHLHILEDAFNGLQGFEAEWRQRELQHLELNKLLDPEDFLLFSDVDEIVKPQALEQARLLLESRPEVKIIHFAQTLTYFYLNNIEVSGRLLSYIGEYEGISSKRWLGSVLARWRDARDLSLTELRWPSLKDVGVRVDDAGWHFSWVGGPEPMDAISRVLEKLRATAHVEFNTKLNRFNLRRRIEKGRDIVRRRGGRFEFEYDPSFLPPYVRENEEKFKHLIKFK